MESQEARRANLGEANEQLNRAFAEELDGLVATFLDPDQKPSSPYPLDPYSMDIVEAGFNELGPNELSPKAKYDLGEAIFNRLGIDPLNLDEHEVRRYKSGEDDV